jgi:hypothetical protein
MCKFRISPCGEFIVSWRGRLTSRSVKSSGKRGPRASVPIAVNTVQLARCTASLIYLGRRECDPMKDVTRLRIAEPLCRAMGWYVLFRPHEAGDDIDKRTKLRLGLAFRWEVKVQALPRR